MTEQKIIRVAQEIPSKARGHGYDFGSFWERLAYGLGTVLVTTGPALLPGMGLTRWMIIFIGFTTLVFIILCLLGFFTSFKGNKVPRRRSGIVHPAA